MGQVVTVKKRGKLLHFPNNPTAAQVDRTRKPVYQVKQPFSAHSSGGWMGEQDEFRAALEEKRGRLESEISAKQEELSRVIKTLSGMDDEKPGITKGQPVRTPRVFPREYAKMTMTSAIINYLNKRLGERVDNATLKRAILAGGYPEGKRGIWRQIKAARTQSRELLYDDGHTWLADDKVACSQPTVHRERKEKNAS